MKLQLLFASNNLGKIQEAQHATHNLPVEIVSPAQLVASGKVAASIPNVDECASTYQGNAQLKADAFFAWSGIPSFADDTGLEVTALLGRPGLYSARYAGEGCDPRLNIEKLLTEMASVSDRRARFYCCLVLKVRDDLSLVVDGALEGEIARQPSGAGGFGYDSVFVVPQFRRTLAELKEANIPVVTHRLAALGELMQKVSAELLPGKGATRRFDR